MQFNGRERAALRELLRAVWGDELVPEPPKARAPRLAGRAVLAFGMLFIVMAVAPLGANATQGSPEHKVTLCHATDSYTNPYVRITVDVASVIKNHGHGDHDGPVFYPRIPKHTKWGDIIPPFDFGAAGSYSGKNWSPAGRAIFDDGCELPPSPNTTTTIEVGSSTTATTAPPTSTTQATATTEPSTTTTSPAGTTTTVADATSTSQPSTQTTQGVGSSTTVAIGIATSAVHDPSGSTTTEPRATGSTASPPTSSTSSGPLAFTGSPALPLVLVGLALIGAGLGLEARRRRRTSHDIRTQ
jgi:hypothetical protein